MARYGKKSLSLLLTLVLLLGLLTGLGMQAAAAELTQYAADGTMTELAEGAKTAAGTYSIADASELRALGAWVNAGNTGEGYTFYLTADIDLGGKDSLWIPIGQLDGNLGDTDVKAAFFGTFDGQGHSVTGLWIGGDDYATGNGRYNAANGLFGVNFGTIQNVYAEVEINTYRQGGAIAGVNFGTVKTCASAGSINANGGGGTRGTGGIVGSNYGSVEACYSSAAVHNDYRRAGGIVGYNAKEVADMDAHGTWNNRGTEHISAESTTFIGSVADCFFVGYASSASREYSGGIAASNDAECTIVNCYWLDGSSADNWGYYQEAEGATGVFDSEGVVAGSGKSLLEALNNDAFVAGTRLPKLWWAAVEPEITGGSEEPASKESEIYVIDRDVALSELKKYETAKSLVKSGKNGESQEDAKGITALDLITKIAGKAEGECLSLTFEAADGFSATIQAGDAAWIDVMLIWEGDGASDESLKSAVNGGAGKQWVNGVVKITGEFIEESKISAFGQDVALSELKKYETAKSLIKSGKNGESQVDAKGITALDLITKIAGKTEGECLSLTFEAADGFSATIQAGDAAWIDVMLIWEGDGASDESLKSAVNGGAGKQWVSGVVKVTGEFSESSSSGGSGSSGSSDDGEEEKEVALRVSIKEGKDGSAELVKEYSKDELKELASINPSGWAYLYYKGEGWSAIVATELVELDALLADAGAAEYWSSGAYLEFTCSDGVYGKSYPTYDDIKAKNLFAYDSGSSRVPAGLAMTWESGELDPVTPDNVTLLATKAYDSGSLRFVYGMSASQFTDETNRPAGARMPTGVLMLTVVYDEEDAPSGSVGTSKDMSEEEEEEEEEAEEEETEEEEEAAAGEETVVSFTDIENHWAREAIEYVAKKSLMLGMEEGKFCPNETLSRAMLAQILYRLAGEPEVSGEPFKDVSVSNWYHDAAAWAGSTGIVNGVGDGIFDGRSDITREQFVVMLFRFCNELGVDTSARADLSAYSDAGDIHSWAQDAMSWAVAVGLVEGRTESTVVPSGTATRAEAATMLMRFCRTVLGMEG